MNQWSRIASYTLILGAIGHFLIVDLPLMILESSSVRWVPYSLVSQLKATVIDWGLLGRNHAFHIFEGFSIWVVVSLIMIGLYNLSVFRHLPPGHTLRLQSLVLGLSVSVIFLIVAIVCFIHPPVIGGALAVAFFGLGIRKERTLGR